MGLGKTIQTIGLMLSNMPDEDSEAHCNLIVAPLSVLANWRIQIHQFVEPGMLKVEEYRGADREATLRKAKRGEINVLLVSYDTLVSDYKLLTELTKEQEEEEERAAAYSSKKSNKKAKRCEVNDAWKKRRSGSDDESEFELSDDDDDDEDHYLPASMNRKKQRKMPKTWIFDIPFWRCILDEGHTIRNSGTGRFKSVMALIAENKLVLTGTPYVNKVSF